MLKLMSMLLTLLQLIFCCSPSPTSLFPAHLLRLTLSCSLSPAHLFLFSERCSPSLAHFSPAHLSAAHLFLLLLLLTSPLLTFLLLIISCSPSDDYHFLLTFSCPPFSCLLSPANLLPLTFLLLSFCCPPSSCSPSPACILPITFFCSPYSHYSNCCNGEVIFNLVAQIFLFPTKEKILYPIL